MVRLILTWMQVHIYFTRNEVNVQIALEIEWNWLTKKYIKIILLDFIPLESEWEGNKIPLKSKWNLEMFHLVSKLL